MELGEYMCIWAGLLIFKLIELYILLWIALRFRHLIFILIQIECIWQGTAVWDLAFGLYCYFETTLDELKELIHWFDRQPKIGVRMPGGWELVAATRSSNAGYQVDQFYPVINCDTLDDPLGPDHASFVYYVEVRQRNSNCKAVIIWQISLLNGGQKNVFIHEFVGSFFWLPIKCFSSSGVIFVCLEWELLIVDVRHNQWKTIRHRQIGVEWIHCLRRIWHFEDGEKRLDGWVIRMIGLEFYSVFPDAHMRLSLFNTVFEIRPNSEVQEISSEGITFVHSEWGRPVRTSSAFGVWCFDDWEMINGPSVLFDESTNSYIYCADLDELFALDQYFQAPSPKEEFNQQLCPVSLNNRECIECSRDGTVYRYEFRSSTLKYLMVKTLFRAMPDLRIQMDADEFRNETGIEGMEAHFRSGPVNTMIERL